MNPSRWTRSALLLAVLLLAGVLFVSGCGRTIILSPSTTSTTTPSSMTGSSLAVQADTAWRAGNMTGAASLYKALANDIAAPVAERSMACERLARIALSSGNNAAASAALNQWKQIAPGVEHSPVWQDLQRQASATARAQGTYSSVCVALALPTTGDYAPFGKKIAAGARVAQTELGKSGAQIDLRIINSESPDWIAQLQQLPSQCVAVGGPLRHERYVQLRNAGITANRAVFAFMPSLNSSDEGTVAWRFFSSPEDQIQAVLRFTSDLGISSYGLLSPSDAYGQRMSNLFVNAVRSRGGTVKTASYDSQATGTWNDVMKSFIGSYMRGKIPVPSTTFQAAFIPDSWDNLELLVPFLFYQGEDRLVLMGTSLWEQGLSNRSSVNVANLDLAIFPGAWNGSSPNASAAALLEALAAAASDAPEFWEGTGYDFVRVTSLLSLRQPASPAEINRRISAAQRMEWAMAPISWNSGKASQELFIFRPTNTGFELVNPVEFKARLDEIRARHARRVGKK